MTLNREALDKLRTADMPLVFVPRCHPDGGTVAAYLGDGVMRVECGECGVGVVDFEVCTAAHQEVFAPSGLSAMQYIGEHMYPLPPEPLRESDPTDPACPSCGWAMSDHGDPPRCPPLPGEPVEGGSRR